MNTKHTDLPAAVVAAIKAIRNGDKPNAATCRSAASAAYIMRFPKSSRRCDNGTLAYALTDAGIRIAQDIEVDEYRAAYLARKLATAPVA
jgi:hypothetical protein